MSNNNTNDLGQRLSDAQKRSAEIAAAGRMSSDAHGIVAGGGTYTNDLGPAVLDAQEPRAETAVVGQYTIDAHTCRAGGGTFIGGHTWRPT